MQNIFEKIDTMFSGVNDDRPMWAVELLDELKEIKELLQSTKSLSVVKQEPIPNTPNITVSSYTKTARSDFFTFVDCLRETYKDSNNYPYDLHYNNMILGISDGGLIYNKLTNKVFHTDQAKQIYKDLYNQNLRDNSVLLNVS